MVGNDRQAPPPWAKRHPQRPSPTRPRARACDKWTASSPISPAQIACNSRYAVSATSPKAHLSCSLVNQPARNPECVQAAYRARTDQVAGRVRVHLGFLQAISGVDAGRDSPLSVTGARVHGRTSARVHVRARESSGSPYTSRVARPRIDTPIASAARARCFDGARPYVSRDRFRCPRPLERGPATATVSNSSPGTRESHQYPNSSPDYVT